MARTRYALHGLRHTCRVLSKLCCLELGARSFCSTYCDDEIDGINKFQACHSELESLEARVLKLLQNVTERQHGANAFQADAHLHRTQLSFRRMRCFRKNRSPTRNLRRRHLWAGNTTVEKTGAVVIPRG